MNNIKPFPLVLLYSVLLFSCRKDADPTINSGNKGKILYFAQAETSKSQAGLGASTYSTEAISSDPTITWNSASIYVDKIAFLGKNSNVIDTVISVQKKVDLLAANPLAGEISLPPGSYKDIRVRLILRKSMNSDYTFELKGTFIDTKGIPISLGIYNSDVFDVNLAVNDITLNPSDKYKANFKFQLSKVLSGITTLELENAYKDPQNANSVYVSSSVSIGLYDRIKANWQTLASAEILK